MGLEGGREGPLSSRATFAEAALTACGTGRTVRAGREKEINFSNVKVAMAECDRGRCKMKLPRKQQKRVSYDAHTWSIFCEDDFLSVFHLKRF